VELKDVYLEKPNSKKEIYHKIKKAALKNGIINEKKY